MAMTELPLASQRLLHARYSERRPVAEIAHGLATTSKAVEARLGRARQAFRSAYDRLLADGDRP